MKKISGERWAAIKGARGAQGQNYSISTHGRVASHFEKPDDGYILKHAFTGGYPTISFRVKGRQRTHFVHRLVADTFCPRKSPSHRLVIHLDFRKDNNHYKNLKWVTRDEQANHDALNPSVLRARRDHSKLSTAEVKQIKKQLADKKKSLSLKMLAKKFGVTDMQIHRIKTGENWSHIKV